MNVQHSKFIQILVFLLLIFSINVYYPAMAADFDGDGIDDVIDLDDDNDGIPDEVEGCQKLYDFSDFKEGLLEVAYHGGIIKTKNGYSVWGGSSAADGTTDQAAFVPITSVNGYTYSGTIEDVAVAAAGDSGSDQYFILTDQGLYTWGHVKKLQRPVTLHEDMYDPSKYHANNPDYVEFHQLGVGGSTPSLPVPVSEIKSIEATSERLALLTNSGEVWVAGYGKKDDTAPGREHLQGEIYADGSTSDDDQWHHVLTGPGGSPISGIEQIKLAPGNAIAMDSSGNLWTWGVGTNTGNDAAPVNRRYPTQMNLPSGVSVEQFEIAARNYAYSGDDGHSSGTGTDNINRSATYFILGSDGKVYVLGQNTEMILGLDKTDVTYYQSSWKPILKDDGSGGTTEVTDARFISISRHSAYTLSGALITADGTLYEWGSNDESKIGQPNIIDFVPAPKIPQGFSEPPIYVGAGGHIMPYIDNNGNFYNVGHHCEGAFADNDTSCGGSRDQYEATGLATDFELIKTNVTNFDLDGDGYPNCRDLDSDNDGISDLVESGLDASAIDQDNDGVVDSTTDVDQDGLMETVDADDNNANADPAGKITSSNIRDTDNDSVPDFKDLDSDNDGIPDVIEAGGSDPDGDGVIGSGPITDTDGDGWSAVVDPDDGGTPLSDPDTDNDGHPDRTDTDSDGDGCYDAVEGAGHFPSNDLDASGALTGGVDGKGVPIKANGGTGTTAAVTDADNTAYCNPFECQSVFYQVIKKDFKYLDPITGTYTTIGSSGWLYNAIGWDTRSNLIYGIGYSDHWRNHLLVVGNDGVARDLGVPTGAGGTTNGIPLTDLSRNSDNGNSDPYHLVAGDMDGNGYLYVPYGPRGRDLIKIDVDTLTYEIVNFNGNLPNNTIGDIVYIPQTRAFWGVGGSTLYKWDMATHQVSKTTVAGLPSGTYGAAYTDRDGKLYVSNNNVGNGSGAVYRINDYTTDNPTAVFLINSELTNSNDGASCRLAPPPPFGIPLSGSLFHDLEPNSIHDPTDPDLTESDLDSANPPTLYVKLFPDADGDCSNGFTDSGGSDTTASKVVEIDSNGDYQFDAVEAGNYCLVLDDDDDPSDSTPYDAPGDGWLYTNTVSAKDSPISGGVLPVTITQDQVDAQSPSEGNDFALFHGSLITGTLFDDTGQGNGDANNALQESDEPGVPGATVTISDDQGHTRTTQTDANGRYALYLPADWGTTTLSHDLRPASGYNHPTDPTNPNSATTTHQAADYADATAPTPNSSAALIELTLPGSGPNNPTTAADLAGLTLNDYNFGVVYPSSFRPDQSGTATTPGAVTYSHTYKPGTQGEVTLSRSGGDYTYQIRVDANCDGSFDPGTYTDPNSPDHANAAIESWNTVTAANAANPSTPTFLVTDSWPRNPDNTFAACAVEVRVLVPGGQPEGAVDLATLTASLAWAGNETNGAPNVTDPASITDTTAVRLLGGLTLEKLGCNVTATANTPDTSDDCDPAGFPTNYSSNVSGKPGDVLEYCIVYLNVGIANISNITITDPVPFFADVVVDAYDNDPAADETLLWNDASGGEQRLSAPADADAGELASGQMTLRAEGVLSPGAGGKVCYRIQVR